MKTALLYTGNLLIKSKVAAMLTGMEMQLVTPKATADLRSLVDEHNPAIVIIDLGRNGADSVGKIQQLRSESVGYEGVILCFGPHIEVDLLNSAKEAGANIVTPNSVFSARGAGMIRDALDVRQ